MKLSSVFLGVLLAVSSMLVFASNPFTPAPNHGPPAWVAPPPLVPEVSSRRLSFPAQALSYTPTGGWIEPSARGLLWTEKNGVVTLAIRRPSDYDGGEVTIRLAHQIWSDEPGDLAFSILPATFSNGWTFETYGGEMTEVRDVSERFWTFFDHEAVLRSGNDGGYAWPQSGEWWHFEIFRLGSYTGQILLLSVSVDY